MKPMRTSACNVTFVAAGCDDLPAARGEGFIATYWKPDAEELAMIAAGLPIRLCFAGEIVPPVSIDVDAL